ncbi:MAG: DEAD/DEAH box helicase, partial [Rhodovibrionaceae bacterium]
MNDITFQDLGLAEPLLRALTAENYETPSPIQAQAIPLLLAGRDLLGIAQTGTGKTAAFSLPLLQRLSVNHQRPQPRSARALILAPTRELAVQIGDSLKTYGRHLNLSRAVILGGVGQHPQVKAVARGVDILIATPGRLLDLVNQGHVRLDTVETLILDEADRMLDMGFVRDVKKIIACLPRKRQSLLFSATMPSSVNKLAAEILDNPERIEVTPKVVTVEKIEQKVYPVEQRNKRALLASLLRDETLARVIVFTRTKHGANRLAGQLDKDGYSTEAIHGNKSQTARQKALQAFRNGQVRVLVATDVAARGIDVDGITHVVNYELPNVPEDYVHRIGRTARAGAGGIALSFCDNAERSHLRGIERLTKRPMAVTQCDFSPSDFPASNDDAPEERVQRGPRNGNGRGPGAGNGARNGGPNRSGSGNKGRANGGPSPYSNAPQGENRGERQERKGGNANGAKRRRNRGGNGG